MSWTITAQTSNEQSKDFKELGDAIAEAANANILMFCSASDEGAKQTDTYPSKATKNIFKIGGADIHGNLYKPVGDIDEVEFILPGKLVKTESLSDSTIQNVQYRTGSSIATALAAGLAALILYCAQIRILRAGGTDEIKAKSDFEKLKQHGWMKIALHTIRRPDGNNKKYLPVWEVFGNKTESPKTNSSSDGGDKIDLIARIATILCNKF